jgi:hypothetical protein
MKIVERAMNNCYLGDGTVHPGDHLLFIHELCELFKCASISTSQVKMKLSFILNSILLVRFIKIGIIFIIFILMMEKVLPKHGED